MNKTGIEWATKTVNPIVGCTEISEACENCYARFWAYRQYRISKALDEHVRAARYKKTVTEKGRAWTGHLSWFPERLSDMRKRTKGKREHVFVGSLTDLFHKNVEDEWRDKIFSAIRQSPGNTYMILTKRERAMQRYWKSLKEKERPRNLWLGVTAENQKRADQRIPVLLSLPGVSMYFVSGEPLLEDVDWRPYLAKRLRGLRSGGSTHDCDPGARVNWLIVGAETGSNKREFRVEWGYSSLAQARNAGIPFFFKGMRGRKDPPKDLLVREFPKVRK